MSPNRRNHRNRTAWLWLGVLLCTLAGAFFGALVSIAYELGIVGVLICSALGFLLGSYVARVRYEEGSG